MILARMITNMGLTICAVVCWNKRLSISLLGKYVVVTEVNNSFIHVAEFLCAQGTIQMDTSVN